MIQDSTPELLVGPLNAFEAKHAPDVLYVEGNRDLLRLHRRVAIVGSRSASEQGLLRASRLAQALAREQVVVVSGLARGIDTRAHTVAMQEGGRTIAVLGTPLDRFYPPENRDLQRHIAREHLLVSQFRIGSPQQRKNFVIRNRLMALLSQATVIVEAGETSGSLSQGWEALRMGRPVFVCQALLRAGLAWPDQMLEHGAALLTDEREVLELLPVPAHGEPPDLPF